MGVSFKRKTTLEGHQNLPEREDPQGEHHQPTDRPTDHHQLTKEQPKEEEGVINGRHDMAALLLLLLARKKLSLNCK